MFALLTCIFAPGVGTSVLVSRYLNLLSGRDHDSTTRNWVINSLEEDRASLIASSVEMARSF